MVRYGVLAGLLAGLLVAGSAAGPPVVQATVQADPAGSRIATGRDVAGSVTLLTGDRVTVAAGDRITFRPAEGRERIRYTTVRTGEQLYVVPSDARRPIAAGRLDRRLFDVAGLIRQGYDDRHRASIPLVAEYADRTRATRALAAAGARVTRSLPAIGGAQLSVAKQRAAGFYRRLTTTGLGKVWLDGRRTVSLEQSVPQIGAPAAWQAGYTGAGVRVAVLDGGIDGTHPDLAGRVAAVQDFTGTGPADTYGHGTHVASTIAGRPADGRYRGVAPDATLLSGKVCEDRWCLDSAILAGMEWAATEQQARVINLSLGGEDTPELDPVEQAVNTLTARTGTLFVVSAGNDGPDDGTVGSPGSADAALTVGAVDKQDVLAAFSSRGPRVGDRAIKPDLTAPGVSIVAARAAGTAMGSPVNEHYTSADGTSMAAPHVAGAAALLAQRHPDWRAPELKAALIGSAQPVAAGTVFQQGAGRLDAARAIGQTVIAATPSLSFGLQQWPHHDDRPDARQVGYRNLGAAEVVLTLTAELTAPDGRPAPAGSLTLSASTLRIPAGGTAAVTVTSDTRTAGPDGSYSGRVTATAGDRATVVPVGVEREAESYQLTVRNLDRTGRPASDASDLIRGLDVDRTEEVFPPDGVTRVRLPKGKYVLVTNIQDPANHYLLVQPTVLLDRDLTITADARTARPVRVQVERASARMASYNVGFVRDCAGCSWFGYGFGGFGGVDRMRLAQIGPDAPADEFTASVGTQWGEPGPAGDFANSPYIYGLVSYQQGRFYTGLDEQVPDAELAQVTTTFAAQQPGRKAYVAFLGTPPDGGTAAAEGFGYDLPRTVTRLHTANGVRWWGNSTEVDADEMPLNWQDSEPRTYQAGRRHAERWNGAVFGPAFWASAPSAVREGNTIFTNISVFSDSAGHRDQPQTDSARSALFRDGRLVAESDRPGAVDAPDLPAGSARYRLETSAARHSWFALSTRVDAAWAFRSAQGDEVLPLWTVRYRPRLDPSNTSQEGRIHTVPVTVTAQPGSPVGRLRSLTVQTSADDGTTWSAARLVRTGANSWTARVAVPAGTRQVSLRARAADSRGNTVEQTVIRAYHLAP